MSKCTLVTSFDDNDHKVEPNSKENADNKIVLSKTDMRLKKDVKIYKKLDTTPPLTTPPPPKPPHPTPNINFTYADSDTPDAELAEFYYNYLESRPFVPKPYEQHYRLSTWHTLDLQQRRSIIQSVLNQLDVSDSTVRMRATPCLLYIAQGCSERVHNVDEVGIESDRGNCVLLYELGVFDAMVELLHLELGNKFLLTNQVHIRHICVILNILYHITEVMRMIQNDKDGTTEDKRYSDQAAAFRHDITHASTASDDLLLVRLLDIVVEKTKENSMHRELLKKLLLLIWKLILVSLGGLETLREEKMRKRNKASLPVWDENSADILRTVVPAFSISRENYLDLKRLSEGISPQQGPPHRQKKHIRFNPDSSVQQPVCFFWRPKVRQTDIDRFVKNAYQKYLGWTDNKLPASLMPYLPLPIQYSIHSMKEEVYTSLADLQIAAEDAEINQPLSSSSTQDTSALSELTAVEILYRAMLPQLTQYMIAFQKILGYSTSMDISKAEDFATATTIKRCKEIIIKAISAILLLLLKHFKLNHIYQFEVLSYTIFKTNITTTLTKFFDQNMVKYILAINDNVTQNLTSSILLVNESNKDKSNDCNNGRLKEKSVGCSWRNMFTCINFLRVFNKVVKWKKIRILWAMSLKSSLFLKRMLEIQHPMTQHYVLKLLKMQTKYLGYRWRKNNSTITRLINTTVRHNVNDTSTVDVKPDRSLVLKVLQDEMKLRTKLDRYNKLRYGQECSSYVEDISYKPLEVSLSNVLRGQFDVPEEFRRNYTSWLDEEVYNKKSVVVDLYELVVCDMELLWV